MRGAARDMALAALLAGGLAALAELAHGRLWDGVWTSGWMLAGLVVPLALLNLRRLPIVPLLPGAAMRRLHVVLGWTMAGLLPYHCGARMPEGVFETLLWGVAAALVLSGALGQFLAVWVPRRIDGWLVGTLRKTLSEDRRMRDERVLADAIPLYRRQLARQVEGVVLKGLASSPSATLAMLHERMVQPFFQVRRGLIGQILHPGRGIDATLAEMRGAANYLDQDGRETLRHLEHLMHLANNLDFQEAHYRLMGCWLLAHVPLTWALVTLVALHAVLAHAFALTGSGP